MFGYLDSPGQGPELSVVLSDLVSCIHYLMHLLLLSEPLLFTQLPSLAPHTFTALPCEEGEEGEGGEGVCKERGIERYNYSNKRGGNGVRQGWMEGTSEKEILSRSKAE